MAFKKSDMRFHNYVGHVLDSAKAKFDEKSIYNDTADDVFDGVFDACINANDYCFFDSDALFENDIKFSRRQRAMYRNTTNHKNYAYYRSYVNTMTRLYRAYKHYKYEVYYL